MATACAFANILVILFAKQSKYNAPKFPNNQIKYQL